MSTTWHLRKPDGTAYGPVALGVLCQWAEDGRVTPGDEVSSDGQSWQPAPALHALAMDWIVQLASGDILGPVHILALREPWDAGQIAHRTLIVRRSNGHTHDAADALATALLAALEREQQRAEALANQVREHSEAAAAAQQEQQTARELVERDALRWKSQCEGDAARHRQAQQELESQAQGLRTELQDARQRAGISADELGTARTRIAELESRIQAAEAAQAAAQAEREAAARALQLAEAAKETPPPIAPIQPDPPDSPEILGREIQRWKNLCEGDTVRHRKIQDELEAQVRTLREEVLDARRQVESMQRQARADATDAAVVPPGGEPGKLDHAALHDMIRRLNRNYHTVSNQADRSADELGQARTRIAELEAQLQAGGAEKKLAAAQAELEAARLSHDELEATHRDILKQFRDLNDRHLRLKQTLTSGPA